MQGFPCIFCFPLFENYWIKDFVTIAYFHLSWDKGSGKFIANVCNNFTMLKNPLKQKQLV